MLTLYDFNGAPSPRRAKMFLTEKGLSFDNIQIDIRKGEQMSEDYRKINPRCTVPALITEDGDTLTEIAEIAAFLEARYPETPLLGTTPFEKSQVAKWNSRIELEGLMAGAEALRNSSPGMKDRALPGPRNVAQIPELAARGVKRLGWFFEALDAQLQENAYVAGDTYSMADITATVLVDFARWVKVTPQESQTALIEWHGRMKERPSYGV